MTRKPNPETARLVNKQAVNMASQWAGRTALVGLLLTVAMVILAALARRA